MILSSQLSSLPESKNLLKQKKSAEKELMIFFWIDVEGLMFLKIFLLFFHNHEQSMCQC